MILLPLGALAMAIPIYDTFAANVNNSNFAAQSAILQAGGTVDSFGAQKLPILAGRVPGLTADFEYLMLWIGAILIILSIIGGASLGGN